MSASAPYVPWSGYGSDDAQAAWEAPGAGSCGNRIARIWRGTHPPSRPSHYWQRQRHRRTEVTLANDHRRESRLQQHEHNAGSGRSPSAEQGMGRQLVSTGRLPVLSQIQKPGQRQADSTAAVQRPAKAP